MDDIDYIVQLSKAMLLKLEGDESIEGRNQAASLRFGMASNMIAKKVMAAKSLYCTTEKTTLEIPKEIWQNIEQHALELATYARDLQKLKAEFDKEKVN